MSHEFNSYSVKCPYCEVVIDCGEYFGDNEEVIFNCPHCKKRVHFWSEYVTSISLSEFSDEEFEDTKKFYPDHIKEGTV